VPCTPPEYSFIRGLHALPELQPVDVYVNNMLRAKNFGYKDMTPYMPSGFEMYNIQIFLSGTNENPLVDIQNLKVPKGQIMTFAILGSIEDIKLLPIIDDINEITIPNETKIRFYNLDSSITTLDLTLPKSSISLFLEPGSGTAYTKIIPGNHRLKVSSTNPYVRPINIEIDFKPSRLYTIYVTGSIDPSSPGYALGNIPQVILSVDGNTMISKCIFE